MAYDHVLLDDEKRELLRIARATLKEYFASGRVPPGAPHRASMTTPGAVFVSIYDKNGISRGSLGQTAESMPLYKAIQEMAIAAVSRDPRVTPVKAEELKELVIEICVLGARRQVRTPGEIELGRDGIAIAAGGKKAQMFPKAAIEGGWTAEELLQKVCEKAGLASDAWRGADAVIEAFVTQTFDEKNYPPLSAVVAIKA
jgi:AmmeMemoRadiSam system protein A